MTTSALHDVRSPRSIPISVLWVVIAIVCASIVVPAALHAAREYRQSVQSQLAFTRASHDAAELESLRAQSERLTPSQSGTRGGTGGLAAKVTACLGSCGLPASTLASLHPDTPMPIGESPATSGNGRLTRQRAVVTLDGVTLPKLGEVLSRWREREPNWTITSLELAPQTRTNSTTRANQTTATRESVPGDAGSGDLPLRVVMSIESIVSDEPASRSSPPAKTASPSPRTEHP